MKILSALVIAGTLAVSATSANALTVAECSAKYKAAKAANTLGDKTWNDFRKAECGDTAAAPEEKKTDTKAEAKPAKPAKPAVAGAAVFPTAVATQYAKETKGKAIMHTCRDQYRSNKATNGNGGLKWIQKGGGYYSECNKRLKGAA